MRRRARRSSASCSCASRRSMCASFDRPNLFLAMRPKSNATRQLIERLGAASRRERHRLLRIAPPNGGTGEEFARHRPTRAALSRRPRALGARGQSGRVPARGRCRDLRHHRLRHGNRQAGRAIRVSRRPAVLDRGLLPGDRPRRARRIAGGQPSRSTAPATSSCGVARSSRARRRMSASASRWRSSTISSRCAKRRAAADRCCSACSAKSPALAAIATSARARSASSTGVSTRRRRCRRCCALRAGSSSAISPTSFPGR